LNKIFIPSLGPTDWRRLLANPETQWKQRKSALEMAVCWESARNTKSGIPPEVAVALDTDPLLSDAVLLMCIPEHKVDLEGSGPASQNDLWALLRSGNKIVSMTIEAKAGEKLDKPVEEWIKGASQDSDKPKRLADLCARLNIETENVSKIRYQLLHRAVSALKEADRFGADIAVMLIQSFNRVADESSWSDFVTFGELMDTKVQENSIVLTPRTTSVPLYLGWVTSNPADLDRLGAAV